MLIVSDFKNMATERHPLIGNPKKTLVYSDTSECVTQIFLDITGMILALPFFLLYNGYKFIAKVSDGKKSKKNEGSTGLNGNEDVNFESLKKSNPTKEFDIILFGATGFTGKLAMEYLIKQYGTNSGLKWAIAGRRLKALQELNEKLAPGLNIPMVVADSASLQSVSAMCCKTKVLLSTVGPFNVYGRKVVAACANLGTNYADISGETDFMRYCIDNYEDTAKANGSKIVIHCGHDSIPWDIGVYKLSQSLRRKGDELIKVKFFDEVNAVASSGTLKTAVIAASAGRYPSKLGYDPLLRSGDNNSTDKSTRNIKIKIQKGLGFTKEFNTSTTKGGVSIGPFFMAPVNANCVRRSNVLLGYTEENLSYSEAQVYGNWLSGLTNTIHNYYQGIFLFTPPLKRFAELTGILPADGKGPSEAKMAEGFLRVTGIGEGKNGLKSQLVMYFDKDPGYADTARMLVETGLALLNPNTIPPAHKNRYGILTPAAAFGDTILDRLIETGTQFVIS